MEKIFKTDEISEYLIYEKEFKLGLLGGDLGWCVFLDTCIGTNKNQGYINAILEKAVSHLASAESNLNNDIHQGLGSLYLMANYLNKRDLFDDDDLRKLEARTISDFKTQLSQSNFDFLFGSTGLCVGFLYSELELSYIAQLYVDKLWELYSSSPTIDIYLPNSKIINFGLAHGVCAVAMLLIEFLKLGLEKYRIQELLIRIGKTLFDLLRKKSNKLTIVPTALNENGSILSTVEIFGWCTGRLSYGLTLLNIHKHTGFEDFYIVANRILDEALEIYDPGKISYLDNNYKSVFEKLCLCHGMPSTSFLFKLVYEYTGKEKYLTYSTKLNNIVQDIFENDNKLISVFKDNLSILNGLSGVLLSVSQNENNKWRKLMLL